MISLSIISLLWNKLKLRYKEFKFFSLYKSNANLLKSLILLSAKDSLKLYNLS